MKLTKTILLFFFVKYVNSSIIFNTFYQYLTVLKQVNISDCCNTCLRRSGTIALDLSCKWFNDLIYSQHDQVTLNRQ